MLHRQPHTFSDAAQMLDELKMQTLFTVHSFYFLIIFFIIFLHSVFPSMGILNPSHREFVLDNPRWRAVGGGVGMCLGGWVVTEIGKSWISY